MNGKPVNVVHVAAKGRGAHRTIADALRAAGPGDTVLVAPGEYRENVRLLRRVALLAEHGPGTVVLLPGPDGPVLTVEASDCAVHGFTLRGADPGQPAISVADGGGLV